MNVPDLQSTSALRSRRFCNPRISFADSIYSSLRIFCAKREKRELFIPEEFHVACAKYTHFKLDYFTHGRQFVSKHPDPQMQPPASTCARCGDQPLMTFSQPPCNILSPAILTFCTLRVVWWSLKPALITENHVLQLCFSPGIAKLLRFLYSNQYSPKYQDAKNPESIA